MDGGWNVVQWGRYSYAGTHNFPIAFSSACSSIVNACIGRSYDEFTYDMNSVRVASFYGYTNENLPMAYIAVGY